jgi:hypothetical protein
MSKNSPKQNVECLKEWLSFMKFKPKSNKLHINNAHNSIGEVMKRNSK